MSPLPRSKENRSLPKRWRIRHGAYYYQVPPGMEPFWDGKKEFRLGKTEVEAYQTWSVRLRLREEAKTMGDLLDRYLQEVVPGKAPSTQTSNRKSIKRLRAVFGEVPVSGVSPKHAYRYRDICTRKYGATSANRDLEVLSHALSMAVEWGLLDRNPVKGQVKKNRIPRRERYIEDWELDEALRAAPPMLRAYVVLKLLTGLRRGDLLSLCISDLKEDGIYVQPRKTAKTSGVRLIIEWTCALREAVNSAMKTRGKIGSMWVFSTNRGQPYIKEDGSAAAFDSLWQRFMRRALSETGLKERFQEKDLRKKVASDLPLEHAQHLLGHASPATTQKHYRILGERVQPAK